jgi:hypothetical protein
MNAEMITETAMWQDLHNALDVVRTSYNADRQAFAAGTVVRTLRELADWYAKGHEINFTLQEACDWSREEAAE